MAMTLAQQQNLINDTLRQGVIETFQEESQVLKYLQFLTINSNSYVYNREASLPGANFRNVNESYTASEGTTNRLTETLAIIGNETKIDRYLTQTANTNDMKALQTKMLTKSLALDFDDAFFNGDSSGTSSPSSFDGLDARLDSGQIIDGGGDSLTLSEVDELIDAVKGANPSVIFLDQAMVRKINNLMRAENQALEPINDQFGRRLYSYSGVPLVPCTENSSGSPVLNDGSSSPAYRMYGVKFAEDMCLGLQSGPIEVVERTEHPFSIISVEWICSYILAHPQAAAKLSNVTL